MDEVRRRAEIDTKFRVMFDRFERGGSSEISVLTNQPINRRILSKILYSGRQDTEE